MEPLEAPELRLNEVCRSCLSKTDDMTNFIEKTDNTSEIIAMLASVGNIEIEINNLLPCYLCKTCEEKLRLSYDFQQLIQRSNEIIKECLNGAEMVLEDEPVEDNSNSKTVCDVVNPVVRRGSKTLPQFSAKEVEDAINEYQEKFYVNTGCLKCGFITTNSRALSIHMSIVHKEMKDRWCSLCNIEVDNLTAHASTHSETHFICKFCKKKFKSRGHLYDHLRSHSNLKPHVCYICQRGFIARRHLEKHLHIHMNNRIFKCSNCPANFALRKSLNIHQRQHTSESKNKEESNSDINTPQNFCKLCKKRVRSLEKHTEKFHVSGNTESKQNDGILCTNCGKKFSCFSRFRLHMRTHTGETPYKCQYCDKRMTNRNHLVIHERTHTGERPYICSVCGRSFSQTSVLNTHMRIHTGRPIQCEICLKRFCRNAQLRLHMRKHTGEKPYQCDQCEQAFKQQSHLSEHLKRHSDERPYKCSHCDKSFKQMSILKSHLMVHTGEKPFKCSQCSYACRQRYSLTQHMRQHSGDSPNPEKPHFCVLCQKGYTTMAMLMSHKELVHEGIK